jgi:prepilin-type processing-associated H-X9-DG protein
MLSGDRNINDHGQDQACPVNVGTMSRIEFLGPHRWNKDPNLHPDSGNILFNDGRVEDLPSSLLGTRLFKPDYDNGSTHLIKPSP